MKNIIINFNHLGLLLLSILLSSCVYVDRSMSDHYNLWDKIEIDFEGPQTSETAKINPFTHFRLNVNFTAPSGRVFIVPGFFAADGKSAQTGSSAGNLWRVNFTPNEKGIWTYNASFKMGENISITNEQGVSGGYFDNASGQFLVKEIKNPTSALHFQSNGKIEYVGEHYLQFSGSKKWFLKGGANSPEVLLGYSEFDQTPTDRSYSSHVKDWRLGDPTWQGNKGKGIIGALNFLASKHNNSFYFLTMNVDGDGKQVWPWIGPREITRFDVSKLDQWGIVFDHMNRLGIMAHMVLTETENESFFEWEESNTTGGFANSRKLYYREMIARFGYLLGVTWNVGEENGWKDKTGDDAQKKANTTSQRIEFANYIQKLTYYNDPIVIHNGPDEDYHIFDKASDNIMGVKAYSGPSLQGNYKKGNIYRDVLKFRRLSEAAGHKWVVSMDEPYVQGKKINLQRWRKDNVWATYMAGGAGIELYLGGGNDLKQQDLRQYEEFYETTGIALNYFYNNVPFQSLQPVQTSNPQVWQLSSENFYLLYFKQQTSFELELPEGNYRAEWFNPKSNVVQELFDFTVVTKRDSSANSMIFQTPLDDIKQDWVLSIKLQ